MSVDDPNQPDVTLDFKVHWCAEHLEPLREAWPKGAGHSMVLLLWEATSDEEIIEMCGAEAKFLDRVLLECAPLCCYIEKKKPGIIAQITAESLVGYGELLDNYRAMLTLRRIGEQNAIVPDEDLGDE